LWFLNFEKWLLPFDDSKVGGIERQANSIQPAVLRLQPIVTPIARKVFD
jgi:hypothetical protein